MQQISAVTAKPSCYELRRKLGYNEITMGRKLGYSEITMVSERLKLAQQVMQEMGNFKLLS